MFCRKFQSAIEEALDESADLQDAALIKHLQKCCRCRAYYQRMTQLQEQLRTSPLFEVSDQLVDNLCAAVSQRIAGTNPSQNMYVNLPQPNQIRFCYEIVAAAAMVMVSLLGVFCFRQHQPASWPDPAAAFVSNTAALQNRLSQIAGLPEQSIQSEIQKLNRNARSALYFLADCIPANPADKDTIQNQHQ